MKIYKMVCFSAVLAASALLCGCNGAISIGSVELPELSGSFSAVSEITAGSDKLRAEIDRIEPGSWEFRFSEPKELSGVVMTVENGEVTASLGELSVTAGAGDYTMLPAVIAEGLDGLGSVDPEDITEENGVLTARVNSCGSKCTATINKQTGDILTFKSPSNKLAVYFSEMSPYTEEVGLVDE